MERVPRATQLSVINHAFKSLLNLQLGSPVRRLNWAIPINPCLDTSPENYPHWGGDRNTVNVDNVGDLVNLRVELQNLLRLPRSNAIVFSIRCYLISLKEIATYRRWAKRLHRVQKTMHPDLIEYKGMTKFHPMMVDWLSRFDDDALLEMGMQPE